MQVRSGGVAVVRVEEQAVRQRLESAHEAVLSRAQLGRDFLRTVLPAKTKLDDLAGGIPLDELLRRPFCGDLALVHDDEAVAELFGLVHVVRRQDQRDAALLQPEESVPHGVSRLRVEPVVGSSRSRTLGFVHERRAIVSRRFMPPDRGSTLSFARSVSCTKSISSSARLPSSLRGSPK